MAKRMVRFKPYLFLFLAFLIVVYVLAPYLWLIISSISTKTDLLEIPLRWLPRKPTLDNYITLLSGQGSSTSDTSGQFLLALRNSTIVSVTVTLLALLCGVLSAYAFARLQFRGKKPALLAVLLMQMIPAIAIIIPLYMLMLKFNLMDNKLSLIIVYLSFVLPFVIWIMKGFLANLPYELEEAARIDGCSRLRSFFTIILPISASGLAATTIFAFIMSWNEFFYALNFTSTMASKTLPVLITEFSSKHGADYIMTSTGGVIASIPPVILALVFQRYIISGLTAGSVKG